MQKQLWEGGGGKVLREAFLEEGEAFETTWKEGAVLGQGKYWREMTLWRDRVRVLVT